MVPTFTATKNSDNTDTDSDNTDSDNTDSDASLEIPSQKSRKRKATVTRTKGMHF